MEINRVDVYGHDHIMVRVDDVVSQKFHGRTYYDDELKEDIFYPGVFQCTVVDPDIRTPDEAYERAMLVMNELDPYPEGA